MLFHELRRGGHSDGDMALNPPSYTLPTPLLLRPPTYTPHLGNDEQRIALNGSGGFAFLQQNGVFAKSTRKNDISLYIYNQPELCYGRNGKIQGTVAVSYRPLEVKEVWVKVSHAHVGLHVIPMLNWAFLGRGKA